MRFYHCFHTDLPDQFVEANSARLIKWVDGWNDKNRYYHRHQVIDLVGLQVTGNAKKDDFPTISANSIALINNWLNSKGHLYNGRYWESLKEDQRSPARIASVAGGAKSISLADYTSAMLARYPSTISQSRRASNLIPGGITWVNEYKPASKPPLRRDSIIAGEIIGYRCWRIENGLLRSVYQTDFWHPNQILEGRELGDWDSRGIHAWKGAATVEYHDYIRGYLNSADDSYTQMQNMIMFGRSHMPQNKPAMLTGSVFLWGDVVEHERGYRAEYARVRSLDWLYPDETMMGREQETLNELRQRYGVGK